MPQEPKKRHSKSQKRIRRAAIMLKALGILKCSNCGQPAIPHIVCRECGFYAGKQVSQAKTKVTKA